MFSNVVYYNYNNKPLYKFFTYKLLTETPTYNHWNLNAKANRSLGKKILKFPFYR